MKICFTGHRPEKLGGYDWNSDKNISIMLKLHKTIEKQILEHPNEEITFICGGALGIDQMAFHICNILKKKHPNIKIELAIPFLRQASKWFRDDDINRYKQHKKDADIITYVDEVEGYTFDRVEVGQYHVAKMQIRNRYMVDNSDLVIAVWDGTKGGTKNCVDYAKKSNKEIIIINTKEC